MTIQDNLITAKEGFILRRISDKLEMGTKIYLGYTHYLHGKKLDEPLLELPEHYEEIENPEENKEENVI